MHPVQLPAAGLNPEPLKLYRLQDKVFAKARGRRLYFNTPTTDNAVQNLYLNAYSCIKILLRVVQAFQVR
jgi:hypothetical protein